MMSMLQTEELKLILHSLANIVADVTVNDLKAAKNSLVLTSYVGNSSIALIDLALFQYSETVSRSPSANKQRRVALEA